MENQISLFIVVSLLIAGIAALVWAADRFVEGAASIADHFGLSPLIIGLTVISIGTSAPEILVSANAAMNKSSGLAVGNALGSNLANIGLVLAITALISPLVIRPNVARSEVPIMLGVTVLAGIVLVNSYLGRWESLFLLLCLILFILFLIQKSKKGSVQGSDEVAENIPHKPLKSGVLTTLFGLVILILSSRLLVWSASELASQFGVSDLVIGVTIVAVGTSLPELAASLAGALKGHSDMAIGNILGSNIFNLLAVLPVAGIIYPTHIEGISFVRDYGTVLALSALLGLACLWKTRQNQAGQLGRPLASIMLLIYIGYYYWLLL